MGTITHQAPGERGAWQTRRHDAMIGESDGPVICMQHRVLRLHVLPSSLLRCSAIRQSSTKLKRTRIGVSGSAPLLVACVCISVLHCPQFLLLLTTDVSCAGSAVQWTCTMQSRVAVRLHTACCVLAAAFRPASCAVMHACASDPSLPDD